MLEGLLFMLLIVGILAFCFLDRKEISMGAIVGIFVIIVACITCYVIYKCIP